MPLKIAKHLIRVGQAVTGFGIRFERLQNVRRLVKIGSSLGRFPQRR